MTLRVDWRMALSFVGTVVKWLAAAIVFPLVVAIIYGEVRTAGIFAGLGVFVLILGVGLEQLSEDRDLGAREAFLVVSLVWLAAALVGLLPYVIAGNGTVGDPVNAFFESMSGFTTTGATVMGDISFDTHSRGILLWRQLTQWLGGMGIVVLAVAILPELSVGGAQLMDAEAPGPGIEKLTPRIAETARVLWILYLGVTALEMVLLYGLHVTGLAPEMTAYNAVSHGLTTMSTGGFSPEARSIEAFSATVQWVIIPFMVAAGTNFALFWHVRNGNWRRLFKDAEFRFYAGILGIVAAILAGLLFTGGVISGELGSGVETLPGNALGSLRHGAFQATAIVTTTGYASLDFNAWSPIAQYILLVAMFIGGSAGSTGGAIKIVRWLVILKAIRRELFTAVHPEAVRPIRLGDLTVDEDAVRGILGFTMLYFVVFFLAVVIVFLDGTRVGDSLAVLDAMSAVAATLGNVGPGFGIVGPMNSYLVFPPTTKLLMIGLMWLGRLEIFPVLVILTRAYWTS